jgi:hypothetical protein
MLCGLSMPRISSSVVVEYFTCIHRLDCKTQPTCGRPPLRPPRTTVYGYLRRAWAPGLHVVQLARAVKTRSIFVTRELFLFTNNELHPIGYSRNQPTTSA